MTEIKRVVATRYTENLYGLSESQSRYWMNQVRKVFELHPTVHTVEIIFTGRKLDSEFLERGKSHTPEGFATILASTPGRYGKGRRDFYPRSSKERMKPLPD